jgi:DNA-directed RNA polymerase specialized sigma subunit
MEMIEKKKEHYLNNKNILAAWTRSIELGRVTDELGRMFLLLATKLTNHRRFVRYPFKEDLVSAGALACVNAWQNFNPTFSQYPNPFAYFSSIVWNAFVAFVKKEYAQSNTKNAMKIEYGLEPDHGYQDVLESQRKKSDTVAAAKTKGVEVNG